MTTSVFWTDPGLSVYCVMPFIQAINICMMKWKSNPLEARLNLWLQVLILCKTEQTCCQIISSGSDCYWWQTKKETHATDHWVASRFYSLSSNPNFWSLQLHQAESIGQWLVLAGERLSAALFPDSSRLNQFAAATLPLRGNKSS